MRRRNKLAAYAAKAQKISKREKKTFSSLKGQVCGVAQIKSDIYMFIIELWFAFGYLLSSNIQILMVWFLTFPTSQQFCHRNKITIFNLYLTNAVSNINLLKSPYSKTELTFPYIFNRQSP